MRNFSHEYTVANLFNSVVTCPRVFEYALTVKIRGFAVGIRFSLTRWMSTPRKQT